ncbi:sulfatase-like hydrolase/transferase [Mahella australiensis]|uniref:Sulfatase n=1 Tax=Mahella australiensis (strain DSM 15567 / CIP 107919 / 50-1 BON) TaxID=697281 RepID=F4A250_MAHA5|nr:sulfatase-like hydrolase/transferase [Mahella australiensis]AEE97189.1 sulfatase [Mahella australiensis 50-1 BON]
MNEKPNIVIVFTDQQRWDTVGCYGNTLDLTPNLDAVAKQGITFKNAFTCQPVCGPARASLQTGRYATATGCFRNHIALPDNEKTIAHYLRSNGYETAYVGKWHLGGTWDKPVPKEKRGGYDDYWIAADLLEFTSHPYEGKLFDKFDNPVEFNKYRVDAVTDFAIEYLKARSNDKPFLLFVSYLEPHHQNDMNRYVAPEGYAERYRNAPVPMDLIDKDGDWKENLPDYYGICKRIDENLGRIIEQLKELDIYDNTILIFTSDHGSHFRTRNSEYKRSCHEASIRIPMIMHVPDIKESVAVEELVSLVDIAPTLLEAAGIYVPRNMHGRSLIPLLRGGDVNWRSEVFVQISESQVGRAIRTNKWKYCIYAPDKDGWNDIGSDIYVEQYLYDLENDPYEQNNLIGNEAYRSVCDALAKALKRQMLLTGEQEPKIIRAKAVSDLI